MPDRFLRRIRSAGIVNRVEPAVVNIATTQVMEKRQLRARSAARNAERWAGRTIRCRTFFDRFFDGRQGQDQDAASSAERSLGSGVIVDKRGSS